MSKHITIETKDIEKLNTFISNSQNIIILPHTSPDGDALGSCMGLASVIKRLDYGNKEVTIISPDRLENYLTWMLSLHKVITWSDNKALSLIEKADLIIHLDHNRLKRLKHPDFINAVQISKARKVMIDHHLYPEEGFDLTISKPGESSTCELVYSIICELGWRHLISRNAATALLTGLITDTGRFLYNCSHPSVFNTVSDLIRLKADMAYINDRLNYHSPINQIQIKGYAIDKKLEIYPEIETAFITLTKEDMALFNATRGDTEGISNIPLEIEGIINSCLIREDKEWIKLSFRSIGDFPVNIIAERAFNGGGHLNASGGEFIGTIEEAKKKYIETVKEVYREHLLNKLEGLKK